MRNKTVFKKPINWEVKPKKLLATDNFKSYWLSENDNIYSVSANGTYTRWLCYKSAWKAFVALKSTLTIKDRIL